MDYIVQFKDIVNSLYAFSIDCYILIINEKVLVLCEKLLPKFSSNLYVSRPPESEKILDRIIRLIELWHTLLQPKKQGQDR